MEKDEDDYLDFPIKNREVFNEEDNGFFPLMPVLNYLSKLNREHFRHILKENGMYPGQEEILLMIMFKNGMKPHEIAEKLSTSLASISVSLKRLESAGLIVKVLDDNDKRSSRIYPSEKAERGIEGVYAELTEFEDVMTSGFEKEELDNLRRYLDKLIYNVSGVEDFSYKHPTTHIKEM